MHRRISVERVVIHPNYKPESSSTPGDIALLRLTKDIPLNLFAKPGCLYPNVDRFADLLKREKTLKVVGTGWGSVNVTYRWIWGGQLRGGRIEPHLKKANFLAMDSDGKFLWVEICENQVS